MPNIHAKKEAKDKKKPVKPDHFKLPEKLKKKGFSHLLNRKIAGKRTDEKLKTHFKLTELRKEKLRGYKKGITKKKRKKTKETNVFPRWKILSPVNLIE